MVENQSGVDRRSDVARQGRIRIVERVELSIFEIAQSRCEPLADQSEQPKDVVARTARSKVLLDVEHRVLIEQPIEHISSLTFGVTDGQDAVVAVLIGKVAVEL